MPGVVDGTNAGSPLQFNNYGLAEGDHLFDTKNLAYWGPYDNGTGSWGTAQYVAFSLLELAGAPAGGDGVEGDWAWYAPDGTHVRVYGPMEAAGWPSTYQEFTVSDSATANVAFFNDVSTSCSGSNDVLVYPGDGTFNSNCSPASAANGGYTTRRGLLVDTGETLPADRLVIGGELVATAYTTTSSTVAVTATVAGTTVPLGNPSGFGAALNGLVPTVGSSVSRAIVFGGGAGGAVRIWLRADNLADVTALTGTLKLYALP
jgi:hypothetical protein